MNILHFLGCARSLRARAVVLRTVLARSANRPTPTARIALVAMLWGVFAVPAQATDCPLGVTNITFGSPWQFAYKAANKTVYASSSSPAPFHFSSDNAAVATVNEATGAVTINGGGQTTFTVQQYEGDYTVLGVCKHYPAASATGTVQVRQTVPDTERGVLRTLFANTSGYQWINGGGWANDLPDVCIWNGVVCADDQWATANWNPTAERHVKEINLAGQRLAGGPLPDLTSLTGATALRLQGNSITGALPPLPPALQVLYLNNNSLTGTMASPPPSSLVAGYVSLCTNQFWAGTPAIDSAWGALHTPTSNWLGCQARLAPNIAFTSGTTFYRADGTGTVRVTKATGAPVTFSSAQPATATVSTASDTTGTLTFLGYGFAAITASVPAYQNYGAGTATQQVNVTLTCWPGASPTTNPAGFCADTGGFPIPWSSLGGGNDCGGACSASDANRTSLDAGSGNLFQSFADYTSGGDFPLTLARTFNSASRQWRTNFDLQLVPQGLGTASAKVAAVRADGSMVTFTSSSGAWVAPANTSLSLVANASAGYDLKDLHTDTVETYDQRGTLLQIQPRAGPKQSISWAGNVQTITDDFGRVVTLTYTTSGTQRYLAQATYPDTSTTTNTITYSNDPSKIGVLTGVAYPDGTQRTYTATAKANLAYDLVAKDGAANTVQTLNIATNNRIGITSAGSGLSPMTVAYPSGNTATVTDPYGAQRSYGFATILGVPRQVSVAQPKEGGGTASATRSYDANGNVTSEQDFRGVVTTTTYDLVRNLPLMRVEAANTPSVARTTTYTWHTSFALPTQIVEQGPGSVTLRTTAFGYDDSGNLTSRTITGGSSSRTWTYGYNTMGQVLTVDGPRTDVSDVTSYAYDGAGRLTSITNAASQVTTVGNYDANGRAQQIVAPDGVVTTLAYDKRGRLLSRQVGSDLTQYQYAGNGLPSVVTLPDGTSLNLTYDGARRLTLATDGGPNTVTYLYNDATHTVTEQRKDSSGTVQYTRTRAYSALGRLAQETAGMGQVTSYGYDDMGNVLQVTDPLGHVTANAYDQLARLSSTVDPGNGTTTYGYDALNNLLSVTAPNSQQTTYTVNGFGENSAETSPNTGTTTYTYDSAGNVASKTDASGVVASYTYDALNRVTRVLYSGVTAQAVDYAYDGCPNGTGKLCTVTDSSGPNANQLATDTVTSYAYSTAGSGARLASKSQSVTGGPTLTVAYGWNAGHLVSVATTGGGNTTTVNYGYANGRPTTVTVNGAPVITGTVYEPFGPNGGWTWANGLADWRQFDSDYRLNSLQYLTTTQPASWLTKNLTWDPANRVTAINEAGNAPANQTFGYDSLDRLTSALIPQGTYSWDYDAVGNRTTQGVSGATTNYTYGAGNQRLVGTSGAQVAMFGYDATGNSTSITGAGAATFAYDPSGRMAKATVAGGDTFYKVNALGQRVLKSGPGGTTVFAYDEAGHLLGEYTVSGVALQETAWLDELPVATMRAGSVYYVHSDQLGTPRIVTDAANVVRWQWDSDPFAATQPNENPAGSGAFKYNLRLPGQVYDAETGLYQNGFRDYSPTLGRYAQSDPIGLRGGLNTYTYALQSPVVYEDRRGLKVVFTGTPATVAALRAAYARVARTRRGSLLAKMLEDSSETFTITNQDDGNAFFNPETKVISVDPFFHPPTLVDTGSSCSLQPAPTDAILGHEMGHAATGTLDDGPDRMNNVRQNENPIRDRLKQPPRMAY